MCLQSLPGQLNVFQGWSADRLLATKSDYHARGPNIHFQNNADGISVSNPVYAMQNYFMFSHQTLDVKFDPRRTI